MTRGAASSSPSRAATARASRRRRRCSPSGSPSRAATVVRTREPGGTDVGVEVREIVLHHRGDIAPRAEALLYAADRAHHVATVVRPGARARRRRDPGPLHRLVGGLPGRRPGARPRRGAGPLAVGDRGRCCPTSRSCSTSTPRPAAAGSTRRAPATTGSRPRHAEFHDRVRGAYLALADAEPERFLVLDATLPVDEIAARIRARVAGLLESPARRYAGADRRREGSVVRERMDELTGQDGDRGVPRGCRAAARRAARSARR